MPREISGDVTALRENLGDALDDFGDAADDTWEEADAALDRVSGAADGLQSACKGFSDAAIGELRTVNSAVDAIEDMLRQWLGALSGKGGNAADQIDEQLQLIGDRGVLEFRLGILQSVEDFIHIALENASVFIQADVAAHAVEELDAKFVFQSGDGGTQRGRGNHKAFGGAGQMFSLRQNFKII